MREEVDNDLGQFFSKLENNLSSVIRTLQTITQQETVTHCLLFILRPTYLRTSLHISVDVFAAKPITRLPTTTLSFYRVI